MALTGKVDGLALPLPTSVRGFTADSLDAVSRAWQVPEMTIAALGHPDMPHAGLAAAARGIENGLGITAAAAALSNPRLLPPDVVANLDLHTEGLWQYIANPNLPDDFKLQGLKQLCDPKQSKRGNPVLTSYLLEHANLTTDQMRDEALNIVRLKLPSGWSGGDVSALAANPTMSAGALMRLFDLVGKDDAYKLNRHEADLFLNHPSGGLSDFCITVRDDHENHYLVSPTASRAAWGRAYDAVLQQGASSTSSFTIASLLGAERMDDEFYSSFARDGLNKRLEAPVAEIIQGRKAGAERLLKLIGESPDEFSLEVVREYAQSPEASPEVVDGMFSGRLNGDTSGCLVPSLSESMRDHLFEKDGYSTQMAWKALNAGTLTDRAARKMAESDDPEKAMVAAVFPHTSGFRLERLAKKFPRTSVADLAFIHPNGGGKCEHSDSFLQVAALITEQAKASSLWPSLVVETRRVPDDSALHSRDVLKI